MKRYTYPDKKDKVTLVSISKKEPYKGYWKKSEDYVLSYFDCMLSRKKPNSLLDLGCGEGRLLLKYSRQFKEVYALEPDPQRMHIAKQKIIKRKIKKVIFISNLLQNAKLPENYFDVIICSHVIQHIPTTELECFIKKINRLLQKEGILVLLTSHSRSDKEKYIEGSIIHNELVEKEISKRRYNKMISNTKNILPVHLFSIHSLEKLLTNFRLETIKIFHEMRPRNFFDLLIFRDYLINLPILRKFFGVDIMIIAMKK